MAEMTARSLPEHQYVWVDRSFIRRGGTGFEKAVWFGLRAHFGRAWCCHVMLECGAVYRDLPPHALAFSDTPEAWDVDQSQRWNVYGTGFSLLVYDYLRSADCIARLSDGQKVEGTYLFTAVPEGDAYSQSPDQAKEFMFIRLENGRLTIQPTNTVLFRDASFTRQPNWPAPEWPKDLKPNYGIYAVMEGEG